MKLSAFPYPGGKTTYCHEIISRLPDHRRYVEPFGGSAAILLNKPPSHLEVYNDLDSDLVQFFRVLRERRSELQEWLQHIPYSRELYEEWVEDFYSGFRPEDPIERAGRWFYLRYSQFNGAIDRRNGFKTGGRRNEARSFRGSIDTLELIADRFREVTIENQSFVEVFDRYDHPDTVTYLDPPYYGTERQHYPAGDEFDHSELVDALRDREGFWLVSYGELPPGLDELASTVHEYRVRYSMAYSDERHGSIERLAMNFDPADVEPFLGLQTRLDAVQEPAAPPG